jgi:hypothetical protein
MAMEKKIHDDRLDEFVKNSFEDYAENPSFDMWDRIEGELPPPAEHIPFWFALRGHRWQLAAAAVIILLGSRLVCVQYYYEEKLRVAAEQKNEVAVQGAPKTAQPPGHASSLETSANKNIAASENRVPSTPAPSVILPVESFTNQYLKSRANNSTAEKGTENTITTPANTANQLATQTPEVVDAASTIVPNSPDANTAPVTASSTLPVKTNEMQLLDLQIPLLSFSRIEHPGTVDAPIKKFREPSGWYFGLALTPHLIVEKTHPPGRPGPGMMRQRYANQQERPQASADVSIRIGKKINTRFALETGLGYQRMTRHATHRPRFEYREGNLIQPSGSAESRSFDYDLNTYGGSASVSLRTEVTGNDAPAATENIRALIHTQEQIQMVHVPILGVVRMGHSRLQAVVKAGITGSYMVKNTLNISASTLENAKLRFRSGEAFSVSYNRLKHLIFGYQLSAGAEFRLSKSLSLSAAPTLAGDFPRSDPQRGQLPGQTAFGINVGANWWF